MPGARRPHRKTRNGCAGCKARRIKCDETKPSCGTCTRYSSQCVYPTPSLPPQTHLSPTSSLTTTPPPLLTPQPSFPTPSCNFAQLELLHFYTTTTCYTFSTLPSRQQIYQHIVPQIAFQHDYLLGAILALSSLHLAQIYPERKGLLYIEATRYQNLALVEFKRAMARITPENIDAVYIFSTFLVPHTWASSDGTGNLFFAEEGSDTAEWVRLLRGCRTLVRDYFEWLALGHAMPLLQLDHDYEPDFSLKEEDQRRLDGLEGLWIENTDFSLSEKEALSNALRFLKETYAMLINFGPASTKLCTISMTIAWATSSPDEYMTLVSQRRPEALVVLAHYCLCLSKIENVWWLKGISKHLLKSIVRIIGSDWERWIAWPLQELLLTEFKGENEEIRYGLMKEENRMRVNMAAQIRG